MERKNLNVCFFDLAKAFDMVSHKHLVAGLRRCGVVDLFMKTVIDLYNDISTQFTVQGGATGCIPIMRGVKQGDPPSPMLFNIAMDRNITSQKNSYHFQSDDPENAIESMAYADDKALLTETDSKMNKNLSLVNGFCNKRAVMALYRSTG